MKQRLLLFVSTLVFSIVFANSVIAEQVEVDGIYYSIFESKGEYLANVVNKDTQYNSYSGDIVIPQTITVKENQYRVNCIGNTAFKNCSNLMSVSIPNTVDIIGRNAFENCERLKNIIIPSSVKYINENAFKGCSGITTVSIPESVTSLENSVFNGCIGLISITLPNSITSIGNYAFENCSGLTSLSIPNSVVSIGKGSFKGCSGLISITIPNSVTSIGEQAFYNCSSLTTVSLSSSIKKIDKQNFMNCKALTSITIPNSVTSIEDKAFAYCNGLISITIPNSVTSIEDEAFSCCNGLISIMIPNSVNYIGNFAFKYCTSLTSITIPNSVTNIGVGLFYGCNNIKNTIVVNNFFVYCPKDYIGHFSISDSITEIVDYAFESCYKLSSITIPNSVTKIGTCSFWNCSGLTSLSIPNSVKEIGNAAFRGCFRLISLTIPNSVINIGESAFNDCTNLEILYYDCSVNPHILSLVSELYIGDNVPIVYDYFGNLPLRKIVLGKSVSQIRANAFSNSQIEEFTITGEEPPYCYPNIFGTQDLSNAKLYVPESKIEYYKTTEPWSKFGVLMSLNGELPAEPEKCKTPTISYFDGKLKFNCETEGVQFSSSIKSDDCNSFETEEITLSACYDIAVIASKTGYKNSDIVTAKLYWLTAIDSPETNINTAKTRGVMATSSDGFVILSGLNANEIVIFYSTDGKELGAVKAIDGSAQFAAQSGSVVVAKIGDESLKIAVK